MNIRIKIQAQIYEVSLPASLETVGSVVGAVVGSWLVLFRVLDVTLQTALAPRVQARASI